MAMGVGADAIVFCLTIVEEGDKFWQPAKASKAEPAMNARHTHAAQHTRVETVG